MPRFNGAATLSLRKCAYITTNGTQAMSFNGAATLSLRKYAAYRFSKAVRDFMLQWGRNFIVAEIRQDPVDGGCCYYAASMGPQLYRCGNSQHHHNRGGGRIASMGPQLYRCGNRNRRSVWMRMKSASMGPQLYRCGNWPARHGHARLSRHASMGPQLYRCGNWE